MSSKVCLVGTLPETNTHHKGPERTTIGIAESLDDRGHNVTVVSDEGNESTVGVDVEMLNIASPPGMRRLARLNLGLLTEVDLGEFDIVHSWRPTVGTDVLSLHALGKVEEMSYHLPGAFDTRYVLGDKIKSMSFRLIDTISHQTVTTSVMNTRRAESFGISVDTEIPVGVDDSFLQADTYDGTLDVLCVGRVEPRKQQHFVCENTPEEYAVKMIGPAEDPTYLERVQADRWEGEVTDKELISAYQEAGVFVLPSVFEGFGLTAVEAMASGTPVVVADTCGIAPFIDRYGGGEVYEFGDGDMYRTMLEKVYCDRESYVNYAKDLVQNHLTWDRIAERYEEVYRRCH